MKNPVVSAPAQARTTDLRGFVRSGFSPCVWRIKMCQMLPVCVRLCVCVRVGAGSVGSACFVCVCVYARDVWAVRASSEHSPRVLAHTAPQQLNLSGFL